MNDSASVVLPVCNAQATLSRQVHELLELLPVLTSSFEILIIDDASSDATCEVAVELAQQYPQVVFIRLPRKMGLSVAIRAGIQRTIGDIILVHDHSGPVDINAIRQVWELRNDQQVVMANANTNQRQLNTNMIHRVAEWTAELKNSVTPNDAQGSIQMIRRQAIYQLSELPPEQSKFKVDKTTRLDEPQAETTRTRSRNLLDRLKKLTSNH